MLYLTKISNAGSEFTENEQKIADFLQANVSELQSVSSRKIAETARHQPVEHSEICPKTRRARIY